MKKISIVVSVYNEELVIGDFYEETKNILDNIIWDYEIIFVNDGSSDNSLKKLLNLSIKDNKVKLINFSRNFGHEAAMIAGIDYCSGDGVVCMDADLQHPPEYIPKIIDKFNEGFEIINLVRTKNKDAGLIKNITSKAFYKILNMISPVKFEANASDFFAITRNAADVLKNEYRERMRFLRGFVQIIGFNKTTIDYEAKDRKAGKSKYNIKKLMKFSVNALLSFSDLPLKLGIFSGAIVTMIGILLMIYTIYVKIVYNAPSGYSTIIVVMCFMFSLLFLIVGIIGEYIAIIFAEIKNRPIYIVKETKNFIDESEKND